MSGAHSVEQAYGEGRVTPQRRRLAELAVGLPGAFTIDELVDAARAAGDTASTATTYRSVAAMEASGFLVRVGSRDGSALYAHCASDAHHHHAVCDGCGRIAHSPCPLSDSGDATRLPDGFVVTRHEITLYGLCAACASHRECC